MKGRLRALLRRLAGGAAADGSDAGRTPELVLLTRPNCHLCEEMEELLERVLPDFGLRYTRRNVASDPELEERFGEVVPVLLRDGLPVAKIRLDRRALERIVRRRR